MITNEEALHALTTGIELMEAKEYRGARKIFVNTRNKLQKVVDEEKRQNRKLLEQAKQVLKEKGKT